MQKLTIQSTYTQVSRYAKLTVSGGKPQDGTPKLKADDGGTGLKPAEAEGLQARSADGDAFTLSVEARAVRVTETITVETEGGCARPGEADRLSRHGQVESLMEALDRRHGHGRRHHYPRLADADDVASRIAEDWDREFASRGGSRKEYADALRERLGRWRQADSGAQRVTVEHSEFRSEVSLQIAERLEAWERDGATPSPETRDGAA